ncbi:hypothetical protein DXG01_000981 [Tephrocybe rancida]|nr:hypothetical protein DXG01_000981 [Tephrocybe rancida]
MALDAAADDPEVAHFLEQWTLNRKINISNLPTWDGEGETIIAYFAHMHQFARLGVKIRQALAEVALQKWTGAASDWWDALPPDSQDAICTDWDIMLLALWQQFMNDEWI